MVALEVGHDQPGTDAPLMQLGELAEARLRANPYLALKSITCDCRLGMLVLRGRVATYYLKQMATAAVADLPGVCRVVNQIDVGDTAFGA